MPTRFKRAVRVLLADDDPDDQLLVRQAFDDVEVSVDLSVVGDGLELLEYLRGQGKHAAPRPDLILLDLNMPRMGGHEALAAIKQDPALRAIPVVALSTSRRQEDVYRTYDLGGSSFITKPSTFPELVEIMTSLERYWFRVVEMPDLA